jgi:hypothetical protein
MKKNYTVFEEEYKKNGNKRKVKNDFFLFYMCMFVFLFYVIVF